MRRRGLVLGFYSSHDTAKEVLRELRRQRYWRSAAIHKSVDRKIRIDDSDLTPAQGAAAGGAVGLIAALSFGLAPSGVAVTALCAALAGAGFAFLLDLGIRRSVLNQYSRWIVQNETLVLVDVRHRDMAEALSILRRVEDAHPATFVSRPFDWFERDGGPTPSLVEPLTREQMGILAARLAPAHRIVRGALRGQPLLARLRHSQQLLRRVREDLSEAARMEQPITPAAEWLLDNGYLIAGHIAEVQHNLTRPYYRVLPVLREGPQAGHPRIYGLAAELVASLDARLDQQSILEFLQAYQALFALTIGELWATPLMLRLALIENLRSQAVQVVHRQHARERADFWAHRLLFAARRDPGYLDFLLSELAREYPDLPPHFAVRLASQIHDEESALIPVQTWLERKMGMPLHDIIRQEQSRQAATLVSISNTITSLRHLALLDWRKVFEPSSLVESTLRREPRGLYSHTDFQTRDRCRHVVETLSRRSSASEVQVARRALDLAREASEQGPAQHVGYYLIGNGRAALEREIGFRPRFSDRFLRAVRHHPNLYYLGGIGLATAAVLALTLRSQSGVSPALLAVLTLLALLPASEIAVQLVHALTTRLLPPRVLPKMSFEAGIPDEFQTLVVVPMMLLTPESIRDEVERLEIRFLANQDPNLFYALLSDFADADSEHRPEDDEILDAVRLGIEELNRRHGAGRFFLFHRERRWNPVEGRWIGWERKRGKIEELNAWLVGDSRDETLLRVGNTERLDGVRFVITLDADTQLPHDTARRLIETLAHPLNRPRLHERDGHVVDGYTVIQPRVSTAQPSAMASAFSRLFTDPSGTDPYTRAISDVYQDLFGEGSYIGKAIYDVAVFHKVLHQRFPDNTLLSHDLIEGAHVRVGLASDIELFDFFPTTYQAHSLRHHRWIRGDWQIARWLLPRVPDGRRRRQGNPLSLLNRWKIFDNLRRSLIAPCCVVLLLISWIFAPSAAWSALVAGLILLPILLHGIQRVAGAEYRLAWFELKSNFVRAAVTTALLPHQAQITVDAIARVLWRLLVSHRHLLEWQTAQAAQWHAAGRDLRFLLGLLISSLLAGLAIALLAWIDRPPVAAVLAFLSLWMTAPVIGTWLNETRARRRASVLTGDDVQLLRRIARQTWRYFDDFVTAENNWLPPDNYQEYPRAALARRTSPTNIGLWINSALAAHDFGYATLDVVVERVLATMETLDRLEKYEGHLLNWYNIENLEPLRPRYVSTADSGNLLASLWVMKQGCQQMVSGPLVSAAPLQGLADALALLESGVESLETPSVPPSVQLASLNRLLAYDGNDAAAIIDRIRQAAALSINLADQFQESRVGAAPAYWAAALHRQIQQWTQYVDRYLPWMEILAVQTEETLQPLGSTGVEVWRRALAEVPSLAELATGQVEAVAALLNLSESADTPETPLPGWLAEFSEAFSRSRWLAGEMLAQAENLAERCRKLADGIHLEFLYDRERNLFAIGYNASDAKLDSAHYDLLASEARLASFIAIARNEVPLEHWLRLGRPFASANRRRVLLSWSGTMFEYLMPLLFLRSYENSMLDQACRMAVDRQFEYARRRGIPGGISESAFSALDAEKIYQYRAFGVPGLGIKRGLEDDLVVAPYATALALAVDPAAAVENVRRLLREGLLGDFGLYEAIDYTRQRRREGGRGVLVQAFMAHHHGMTLLAIDNAINDGIMQARFHADPRVRATEPLLFERIPTSAPLLRPASRQEEPVVRLSAAVTSPAISRFDTADTPTPKTHLISNGNYSVMVTNAGGGYSRWRDFDITRWRADSTRDIWGSFCYVRDVDEGHVWTTTYHPLSSTGQRYAATFTADRAEFRRRDEGVDTVTQIVVSPVDDAEVRYTTLVNRSTRRRRIELTSYVELALAPHMADRAHPAFSKLFVQTEALRERAALLAWRRPRSPEEVPVWSAHLVALEQTSIEELQFETDRCRFIGRGRSVENPQALDAELSNTAGFVLDPIFSLRVRRNLDPGQRISLALVTLAAESRPRLLELIEKYHDLSASIRTLEMAWTHAQLEFRYLGIQPEDAQRFQNLASHVLYPNARHRAVDRIRRNALGQSRLWAYGISGDLPIVLLALGDSNDLGLVREVLLAHTYWRARGLKTDLVILNSEAPSYEQPLKNQLMRMIQAHSLQTGMDQPGGVFLRTRDQMSAEDTALLQASARVVLIAERGSLARQLSRPAEAADEPPVLRLQRSVAEEPSAQLAFMELPYFNGLGGFTQDGREYAIYLGPDDQTPAPWVNVMANPLFGAIVSESGVGPSWYGNSQSNRLTAWSNDPVSDPPSSALYIRDEETGSFWTPTPLPIRELDAYRARHGAGYTVFEHNSHAIEQELTVFVPAEHLEAGVESTASSIAIPGGVGYPVLIQRLRLRNASSRVRRLSVTAWSDWTLGSDREDTQLHIVTEWDARLRVMFARNAYHADFGHAVAFAALLPAAATFTADRTEFVGRNGSLSRPAALGREGLSGRAGAGLDPCAAIQTTFELAPGQSADAVFLTGQCDSVEQVRALVERFGPTGRIETALAQTREWWNRLLGAVEVETPHLAVNFMLNRWLLYQTLSCRIWARSAFYQSGGAFGFRDQLQDVMAILHIAPGLAREHLLRAARHQFVEGDVQHWWHPPSGAGVRTRCSDDLLWLPFVTSQYIRTTGDSAVLDEPANFIEGRQLEPHEHEIYMQPEASSVVASLFDHCRRAIERGLTSGPHGLPLIGSGDWNDGLNRVGIEGRGESVWLAWFLIEVLNRFSELCELRGQTVEGKRYRQRAVDLARAVEEKAWDGQWYRRGYFDDGSPLGSGESEEARIDSLPQSWAVLSGAADPRRATQAMQAVDEHLIRESEQLILLYTPPFDQSSRQPGYIKGYPPGVRENGGQYTHAALWTAQAFVRLGQRNKAADLLEMLNPIERTPNHIEVARYCGEPYVVAADIYALKGHVGRAGWTWYTGSSGWMYRVWLEDVLGFKRRGETLLIEPAVSDDWKELTIRYRFGQARYEIRIENPDGGGSVGSVELDGQRLSDSAIPLRDDGAEHKVLVRLAAASVPRT
ncbi:MAG: GH36-type glycosyl hydrolase domain-containing protein [Acidobacteriota bacterium]